MIKKIKRFIKLNIAQPYWNSKGSFIYCGQKIFFPKNSVIFRRTIQEGIFEAENLRIEVALVKPNTEVFDVGANIGIMLAPLLKADKTITLVAIEASPNNLPYLKMTHMQSPFKDRWTVIDKAAFDRMGKLTFQLASAANGAYDSIFDNKRIDFVKTTEVECTTIDAIWDSRNNPDVSFIKIDIEGADLIALRGGVNCISKCKPAILMEWNLTNIVPFNLVNKDLWDFTQTMGYAIYSLPSLNKAINFKDFDLFSRFTENFLLIYNNE